MEVAVGSRSWRALRFEFYKTEQELVQRAFHTHFGQIFLILAMVAERNIPFPLAVLRGYFRVICGTWFPPGHFPPIYFLGEVVILIQNPWRYQWEGHSKRRGCRSEFTREEELLWKFVFLESAHFDEHMTQRFLWIPGAEGSLSVGLCGEMALMG